MVPDQQGGGILALHFITGTPSLIRYKEPDHGPIYHSFYVNPRMREHYEKQAQTTSVSNRTITTILTKTRKTTH